MSGRVDATRLLRHLDALKLERLPLPRHHAATCDDISRMRYATMLAALLIAETQVSAEQSRLFQMLLTSLDLQERQAWLFEQAQALEQEQLREFFSVIDAHGLATSFFMDALVLCRLAGPLKDAQHSLLAELAEVLRLEPQTLSSLAILAAMVLGLPCEEALPENSDFATVSVWHDLLCRPLTEQNILVGVRGGLWQIDTPLTLDDSWSMEHAYVRFGPHGQLRTAPHATVSIRHCHFQSPVMIFDGLRALDISDCVMDGEYAEAAAHTAFTLIDVPSARFQRVRFGTRHARAVWLRDSRGEFSQCIFKQCGHAELLGGAIAARDERQNAFGEERNIVVDGCHFDACQAKLGGAIRVNVLRGNSIVKSQFENCVSLAYQPKNIKKDWADFVFGGGAVFADAALSPGNCIVDSKFSNTSVRLGDCYDGTGLAFIQSSEFSDSHVAYHRCYSGNQVAVDCIFNNGRIDPQGPVELNREHEKWREAF